MYRQVWRNLVYPSTGYGADQIDVLLSRAELKERRHRTYRGRSCREEQNRRGPTVWACCSVLLELAYILDYLRSSIPSY
jgi:hypothetical protein